jgi:hypothetical protein
VQLALVRFQELLILFMTRGRFFFVKRRSGPVGATALDPRGEAPSDVAHVDQHGDGG